jgi:hypothetical protein
MYRDKGRIKEIFGMDKTTPTFFLIIHLRFREDDLAGVLDGVVLFVTTVVVVVVVLGEPPNPPKK